MRSRLLHSFGLSGTNGVTYGSGRVRCVCRLRKEIAILKKLRHDNVVRLREVIDAKSNKYIFLGTSHNVRLSTPTGRN